MWLLDTSSASQPSFDSWARVNLCIGNIRAGGCVQAPLPAVLEHGDLSEAKSKGLKLSSSRATYATPPTVALIYKSAFLNWLISHLKKKSKFSLEDLGTLG